MWSWVEGEGGDILKGSGLMILGEKGGSTRGTGDSGGLEFKGWIV